MSGTARPADLIHRRDLTLSFCAVERRQGKQVLMDFRSHLGGRSHGVDEPTNWPSRTALLGTPGWWSPTGEGGDPGPGEGYDFFAFRNNTKALESMMVSFGFVTPNLSEKRLGFLSLGYVLSSRVEVGEIKKPPGPSLKSTLCPC